jgi:hypothetical protein
MTIKHRLLAAGDSSLPRFSPRRYVHSVLERQGLAQWLGVVDGRSTTPN